MSIEGLLPVERFRQTLEIVRRQSHPWTTSARPVDPAIKLTDTPPPWLDAPAFRR